MLLEPVVPDTEYNAVLSWRMIRVMLCYSPAVCTYVSQRERKTPDCWSTLCAYSLRSSPRLGRPENTALNATPDIVRAVKLARDIY